jgi:hypothetical protein
MYVVPGYPAVQGSSLARVGLTSLLKSSLPPPSSELATQQLLGLSLADARPRGVRLSGHPRVRAPRASCLIDPAGNPRVPSPDPTALSITLYRTECQAQTQRAPRTACEQSPLPLARVRLSGQPGVTSPDPTALSITLYRTECQARQVSMATFSMRAVSQGCTVRV